MTFRLVCENCGADIPADYIADSDGARLFGCCACGIAKVEYDFAEIAAPFPPGLGSITDAAPGEVAASEFWFFRKEDSPHGMDLCGCCRGLNRDVWVSDRGGMPGP